MSKKILYASIDGDVHDDLRAVAALAGLSVAKATEAILAAATGRAHQFSHQVDRARKLWKANQS